MSERNEPWPAGTPSWVDLTTLDVPRAMAFYGAVLGWTFSDPDPAYGGYAMSFVRGLGAAGIAPAREGDTRAYWTLYFATDDADRTEAAVIRSGGQVMVPATDVGPLGRFVIAADPSGGVFGAWQAGEHLGAGVVNEPGGLTWEDLRSTDPDAARAFYASVFGFEYQAMPGAGDDYRMVTHAGGGDPLGGIGGPGGHEGVPSHWLVYFGVADADTAVATAVANGGTSLGPAFDSPYGRMAPLADPDGAPFMVVGMAAAS